MLPHLDAAFTLAKWLLGNEQDAEDVVQESFLRAYRFFDTYHDDNSRAWILMIVRNTSFSWMRRHYAVSATVSFDEELHSANTTPITANLPTPEKDYLDDITRKQINHALEKLAMPFREVLVLHELQGLPYAVIANITGCPIGTVMSRLSRARKHLQQMLQQTLREESSSCDAKKPKP
ncbi:MAG TPA: sigma-70 family RNA polymerase sigma factor [Gammaproteobacteria bacterium]|nr:sigma-70 family RNA polymerase sigma factor [Gammaproteobacteria bacterium]